MFEIYNEAIYRPILNILVWLYNTIPGHDMGFVIILITLVVRIIVAPLTHKSLKGQRALSAIQPKLNELREIHKDDKEAHAKAMMDLYKEHKVNPLSSCLPLIIQMPILIALYQVFSKALKGNLNGLYSFVYNPGTLNPNFLGSFNLSEPNAIFAILAGLAQFVQSKTMQMWQPYPNQADPTSKMIQTQMTYLLPVVSAFIAWKLPSGLPLFWIVTTLFAIAQQYYIHIKHPVEQK